MQKFITVAEGTEKAFLLPTTITNVTETFSTDTRRPGDLNIGLASRGAHNLLQLTAQTSGTTAREIADALRAAGKTLIEMPYVWGEKHIGTQYVDPTALTFISTSQASKKPDEAEATMAVLIGLKGGGYVETYAVPEKTVRDFMAVAFAANPNLCWVDPAIAHSRFYSPGFTAYDPAEIVRIYPNGSQVNVLYRDGFCSDFNLPRVDHMNEHTDKLFNRIVRLRGGTPEAEKQLWSDKDMVRAISRHASKVAQRTEKNLRRAFAEAVAADTTDLYSIKGADEFYYTSLRNVSRVTQTPRPENCLYVDYIADTPEGRGMHAGGRHVPFKDEKAARAALKDMALHLR